MIYCEYIQIKYIFFSSLAITDNLGSSWMPFQNVLRLQIFSSIILEFSSRPLKVSEPILHLVEISFFTKRQKHVHFLRPGCQTVRPNESAAALWLERERILRLLVFLSNIHEWLCWTFGVVFSIH